MRVVQVEERQQCEETGRELAEGEDAIGADADLWVYGEYVASIWRVYGEYVASTVSMVSMTSM